MDLPAVMRARYSARRFLPQPVPDATLGEILELAQQTPSWCNTQPSVSAFSRSRKASITSASARLAFSCLPKSDTHQGRKEKYLARGVMDVMQWSSSADIRAVTRSDKPSGSCACEIGTILLQARRTAELSFLAAMFGSY